MKKYTCKFTVPADSIQEAEKKLTALTVLASNLNANELEKLADIVKNDPVKTALAKRYLGL